MVPRADRAQLSLGQLQQSSLRCEVGLADALQHGIVRVLAVDATNPKADRVHDLVHHRRGVDLGGPQRRAHRQVPAADVVAHARRRDVPRIGDRRADWRGVPHVMVGAEHAVRSLPQAAI